MAFGFPPRFVEKHKFEFGQDELFEAVKATFDSLGWRGYKVTPEKVFNIRLRSFGTWGEDFTVKIQANGTVEATSLSLAAGYTPQIFDFGANRQNVENFFASLEMKLEGKAHELSQK